MDFFSFLKRNFFFFLVFILIFAGAGFWYQQTHQTFSAKTTMFLTIATQDSVNPEQAEVASTYFGETIMGWFRNPVFVNTITKKAGEASLSALKQERQNMLVEIVSGDQEVNKAVATATWEKLQEEVARYNTASRSRFVVIDQGRTTKVGSSQNFIFPIAGAILGFLLIFILLFLRDALKNTVQSTEEAEKLLGVKTLDFLKKEWEKNDLTLLSVAIQKAAPITILAGVSIPTDVLAVALAHKHSFFGEKLALVDGDLKNRSLQETLGLSNRMKNLKGHTDALIEGDETISAAMIVQNTLDENLKFLPAGKGQKFLTQVFVNMAQEMKTLIHTTLPENSEVLRLSNATLFLVVQIGKTKKRDLKRIREVWNEDLRLVMVE